MQVKQGGQQGVRADGGLPAGKYDASGKGRLAFQTTEASANRTDPPYGSCLTVIPVSPNETIEVMKANQYGEIRRINPVEARLRFGQYVHEARLAHQPKKLSQAQLANAWGKSQTTVSEVEKGTRAVYIDDIEALAVALDRPLSEVMDMAGFKEQSGDSFVLEKGRRVVLLLDDGKRRAITIDRRTLAVLNAIAVSQEAGD